MKTIPYYNPVKFLIIPKSSFTISKNLFDASKLQNFPKYFFNGYKNEVSFEVNNKSVLVSYDLDSVGNFISDPYFNSSDPNIDLFIQYFLEANTSYKKEDFKFLLIPDDSDLKKYIASNPLVINEIDPGLKPIEKEYIKGIPNEHLKYYAAGAAVILILILSKSKKKKRKK